MPVPLHCPHPFYSKNSCSPSMSIDLTSTHSPAPSPKNCSANPLPSMCPVGSRTCSQLFFALTSVSQAPVLCVSTEQEAHMSALQGVPCLPLIRLSIRKSSKGAPGGRNHPEAISSMSLIQFVDAYEGLYIT